MKTPVELVIDQFGVRPLGRLLDINPSTILRWRESGRVPSEHHVKLIQMSGGELSAEDLVFGRK
jgi:predicted lysophospholipase L1 biosynthesis ABC-type transport system permease subunit